MKKLKLSERFQYYCGILCATGMRKNIDINDLVHISALLEAEEKGLLLKLPCKVGDTVYGIQIDYNIKIDKLEYSIEEEKFEIEKCRYFGEYVFLTKEEAEAKLKELQE